MTGPVPCRAIRLQPGLVLPFGDLPDRTAALDGVVLGRHVDPLRYRFSFDHHETPRFGVLSTCEQVCDAIEMGLDPGRLERVLANDVDRDVAAAVWLLLHPSRAALVRERVAGLGRTDSHGPHAPGAVPTPHLRAVFPRKGTTPSLAGLFAAVDAVGDWLETGVTPPADAAPPDPDSFAIVCPEGTIAPAPYGAAGLYAAGWTAFILGQPLDSGSWRYTYAKKSDFVPFDFSPLLRALHSLEPGWGGASTIGGGPRVGGSRIAPRALAGLMRACCVALDAGSASETDEGHCMATESGDE